jgi:putative transposase
MPAYFSTKMPSVFRCSHRKTPLTNGSGAASVTVSIDFFVVPTVRFKMLFASVVLAHQRRRVVHFNVTDHPTAQWTGQQIIEAFPWDTAPKYLLRDRDSTYGSEFQKRVESMGIEELLTAPRSPWQKALVERLIGSIR